MTTIMEPYFAIKQKYRDAVLLFRVSDFYETFNEDAKIISMHLGVMLISSEENADLKASASLPHHMLDTALYKLVKAGHKVAVCDQLEAPKAGSMKRSVTRLFPE